MDIMRRKRVLLGMTVAAGMVVVTLATMGMMPLSRISRHSVTTSDDDSRSSDKHTAHCVKKVHIFGSYDVMRHIPEIGVFMDLFRASRLPLSETEIDCHAEGYDCDIALTMGAEVEMIKGKDAVVFGFVPVQFRNGGNGLLNQVLEVTPEENQTWIYFSTEPPLRVLRWTADVNLSRLKYHMLMTYDRESEVILPFGYYKPFNKSRAKNTPTPAVPEKKGLITWMASNCHSFWPRTNAINHLGKFLPLDTFGKCGKSECLPKRSERCNNLMSEYKFYLATPNSECRDYITEKFWMVSLKYGTVPVVIGAKKEDYERVAPPNSYIHAADFGSFEELSEFIKHLGENDKEYRKYYDWRRKGEVVLTFPSKPEVFCQALPHLKVGRKRGDFKYLSDSPWYQGCRMPTDSPKFHLSVKEEKVLFDLTEWSVWR